MSKFRVGDEIAGNNGYSFDPSIGIILKVMSSYCYVKVTHARGPKEDYAGATWSYQMEDLKLIQKDWDE